MELFKFLLRTSWKTVALAILMGAVSGISSAGLLAVLNTKLNSNKFSASSLMWTFVGLCVLVPIARYTSEILLIRLGQGAILNLRMQLCRRILAAPLRHLEEVGAHRLLATLTDDVPSITNSLTFIPVFCINAVIVIGCLSYLGWLSLAALFGVLGFMLVGVVGYRMATIKAMNYHRQGRDHADNLYHHFRALTTGTKELKIHRNRREAFLMGVLRPTATALLSYNLSAMKIFVAAASWGQILFFIVIGTLVFALPNLQQQNISTEVLTGSTLTLLYMMTPLEVLLNSFPNMSRANIALRKVEQLGLTLAAKLDINNDELPARATAQWQSLEMAGITHAYHREKENSSFILGPIDLTLHPGETVFVIGGNGSGKTTLVKLLIGLYAPESGEIRLDGRAITDETRDAYRQYFSVVFSDFYLFESLLGIEAPELDAKARQYLELLHLEHKVQVKDGELSTTDLSQGQRKRLALLAAYLEDRPIYIFDEWAADQDPQFKEIFYMQLLPELKARGKTTIVITHDDRYYHTADRLVKLDYGKLNYDKYLPPTQEPLPDTPLQPPRLGLTNEPVKTEV